MSRLQRCFLNKQQRGLVTRGAQSPSDPRPIWRLLPLYIIVLESFWCWRWKAVSEVCILLSAALENILPDSSGIYFFPVFNGEYLFVQFKWLLRREVLMAVYFPFKEYNVICYNYTIMTRQDFFWYQTHKRQYLKFSIQIETKFCVQAIWIA